MFGYVTPDKPYLYMKDDVLYKALYCGVCKGIGKSCGQISRFTLTYDITFMSAIIHNLLGVDVKIKREHCVAHPLTKRPMANVDEITEALGALNVVLAYYKLSDDVLDEKKGGIKRFFIKGGFKRAAKKYPEFVKIVESEYKKLYALESNSENRIDVICDPFANMLKDLSRELLKGKSTEYTDLLFYNLGKWIYLIDALDDYDKDLKKGDYNAFKAAYNAKNYAELKKNNAEEISFILGATISAIDESLLKIEFKFNSDLIKNVASRGTKERTKTVLLKTEKNKKKESDKG